MRMLFSIASGLLALLMASPAVFAQNGVWTDTDADDLPESYAYQGEYTGFVGDVPKGEGGKMKLGAQVIALGGNEFQAVLYPGGLPGDGWDGENRSLINGSLVGEVVRFTPAIGNRKYLAKPADQFSATKKFPPQGHEPHTGQISGDVFTGKTPKGYNFRLQKTVRKSDTLGLKPPTGATVLFDGSNKDAFQGGRVDDDGELNTDGKDIRTKDKFDDYTMHIEFMLPYRPDARGQGRGNSGFYQVDQYEVQILDSFGLEGLDNECGGVYKKADPLVNMCFPPLTWQTYDVDFTNAETDENGKVTSPAKMTVRHNGVVIHDGLELNGKTGGARNEPLGTPGQIKLQGHGNPVQFKNIWIQEK